MNLHSYIAGKLLREQLKGLDRDKTKSSTAHSSENEDGDQDSCCSDDPAGNDEQDCNGTGSATDHVTAQTEDETNIDFTRINIATV